MTRKVTAILATNDEFLVGYGNGLPWKCSPDLKRFKELTTNDDWVVMGYNTFKGFCETWPSNVILPERKVWVLYYSSTIDTKDIMSLPKKYGKTINMGCFNLSYLKPEDTAFFITSCFVPGYQQNVNIIGGSKTFELFAPVITDIQLTRIITPEGYIPPLHPENPIYLGSEMRTGKPHLEQVFKTIKDGMIKPISSDEDVKTGVRCEFYHIKV
jgi:dihydrofolate reductase